MTNQEAARCLALLTAYYPNSNLPEETQNIWLKGFKEYTTKETINAINEIVKTESRFPSLASFLVVIKKQLGFSKIKFCVVCNRPAERIYEEKNYCMPCLIELWEKEKAPREMQLEYFKQIQRILNGEISGKEVLDNMHERFGCPPACQDHKPRFEQAGESYEF